MTSLTRRVPRPRPRVLRLDQQGAKLRRRLVVVDAQDHAGAFAVELGDQCAVVVRVVLRGDPATRRSKLSSQPYSRA